MHLDYSFNSFRHRTLRPVDGPPGQLGSSLRHQLLWSALCAACATSLMLSPDVRTILSTLLKLAWLYMAAGARG